MMAKNLFDGLFQEDVGEMEECDHGPANIYIYLYIYKYGTCDEADGDEQLPQIYFACATNDDD